MLEMPGLTLEGLEQELYLKPTGYCTAIVVEPGGTENGLDYGPELVEVVVLGKDGRVVAYRECDDMLDGDWRLGSPADALELAQANYEILNAEGA